jgi:hypothetical protein
MHLRSAVDIVLALLFSPQPSSLAALFERKFWSSGCCEAGGIILFPAAKPEWPRGVMGGCEARL